MRQNPFQRAENQRLSDGPNGHHNGERKYGETYAQAVEATGRKAQDLMDMAWVSSAIKFSERSENLSWSHHAAVAKLEPSTRREWLDAAEENGWSTRELRDQIKQKQKKVAPEVPLIAMKAKANQRLSDGPKGHQNSDDLSESFRQQSHGDTGKVKRPLETIKEVAKIAGVSHDTISARAGVVASRFTFKPAGLAMPVSWAPTCAHGADGNRGQLLVHRAHEGTHHAGRIQAQLCRRVSSPDASGRACRSTFSAQSDGAARWRVPSWSR